MAVSLPRKWRSRIGAWAPIFLAYFSTQTLVQLLGIASGLMLVNFMPVREFALYTLAMSALTFFSFLSDLGSTSSLVHFFRKSAQEGEDFQPYVEAVFALRRTAFLIGAAVVLLAFPVLAKKGGFGGYEVVLVSAGVLLSVWFQIGGSLRILSLRLADRYGSSYRAEVAGAVVRLSLVLAMLATAILFSWVAVLAGAVATVVVYVLARPAPAASGVLRRWGAVHRRRVLRYLFPTLPGALYFAVQGPLTVWLAASFGSTRNIAEVGALGRLSLVVGLFSGLIGTVFLPRLAQVKDDRLYLRRFLQFGAVLTVIAASILLAAVVAPKLFLTLLGPHFSGLRSELLLVVAGSGLAMLDGYVVGVNTARSWTRWQGAFVALLMVWQFYLIVVLPLSETFNVLLFNVLSVAAALIMQLAVSVVGFTRPQRVLWH